jgi:hypothetical protein
MDQITWTKVEKGILKSNSGKYRARITKTMPDGSTKLQSKKLLPVQSSELVSRDLTTIRVSECLR